MPAAVLVWAAAASAALAAPPQGFVSEPVGTGWNEPVGVVELPDHALLVWERGGRVWRVQPDGTRDPSPLIDISDEVLAWRDHGLLGLALDPHFESNGHIYLAYAVDRHHLDFFGTPSYDPGVTTTSAATIARIVRYTADPLEGFTHVHDETRLVLLGATREDGIPLLHQSHGIGSLAFGTDGTLMVTAGDSADYSTVDTGGQVAGGYVNDALAAGILRPEHNVGAYRAQLVDCLNGKMLRLDPATGEGVPSNPHFDPAEPRAARSRVWAIGLRNPFRMAHVPGTGDHLPSQGNPGEFIISDVGWGTWEEVNHSTQASQNFGWPIFEGLEHQMGYHALSPLSHEAPNPLAGINGCATHFRFRDLVCQATQATPPWVNPCAMLQAEQMSNGANAAMQGVHGGAQGHYYNQILATAQSWLEFPFTVASAGVHAFTVRYASPAGTTATIRVDGVVVGELALPATGAFTEWRTATINLTLAAGLRKVRVVGPPISPGPSGAAVALLLDAAGLHAPGALATVPEALRRGTHTRPVVEWTHNGTPLARTPGWNAGGAVALPVGGPGGAAGEPFNGYCAIAGSTFAMKEWPAEWQNRLWFADYVLGWIRAGTLGPRGLTEVQSFDEIGEGVVGLFASHHGDALYVVSLGEGVVRYRFAPSGNQPPVVSVSTGARFGPSPLAVQFDASGSSDPEGGELDFEWHFGDGGPHAHGPVVSHLFGGTGAPALYPVTLTVTDDQGASVSVPVHVWTDNTPPSIRVISPADGQLYSMDEESTFPLQAMIADAEHPTGVTCEWRTVLHHNTHTHPEPPDLQCESSVTVSPLGCGEDTFWLTVELTATDPLGLASTQVVTLQPDCFGMLDCAADLNFDGVVNGADLGVMLSSWNGRGPADLTGDGLVNGQDLGLLLAAWGACP